MSVVAVPNRRLVQGARSRERILDAASRLMASRGYAATSISSISAECGLPPSSIYWAFGSKEGLVAAVMERGAERWFADLPSWRTLEGGAVERLERSLAAIAERLADQPEFLRLYLLLSIERREVDPRSLDPIRRIRQRAIDGVAAMLARVLEGAAAKVDVGELTRELARFTICFCDGAFVAHQIEPAQTDLGRLVDDLRIGLLAIAASRLEERSIAARGKTSKTKRRGRPRGR